MLRIAFAGTPDFAVPALRALAGSHHRLVGVLTQPDRPAGRGASGRPRELKASAVKRLAAALALPLAQPARLNSDEQRAPLRDWASDLLVVVAYGLLLPPAVLDLPRLGCINIHASLLPRWRGAAPVQRAILAGDLETGVTILQMDQGLDTGAILSQRRIAIGQGTDAGALQQSLAALGAQLLLETLDGIEAGRAHVGEDLIEYSVDVEVGAPGRVHPRMPRHRDFRFGAGKQGSARQGHDKSTARQLRSVSPKVSIQCFLFGQCQGRSCSIHSNLLADIRSRPRALPGSIGP